MTPTDEFGETPGRRFARALTVWVRVWLWALGIGFVLALLGIAPSAVGIVALTGPLWMVIVALVLWGRMLDELLRPRSDMEDGPR